MNEATLYIVTLRTIQPEDSGAAFEQKNLHVSARLGMSGGKSSRHAKNPLLGEC